MGAFNGRGDGNPNSMQVLLTAAEHIAGSVSASLAPERTYRAISEPQLYGNGWDPLFSEPALYGSGWDPLSQSEPALYGGGWDPLS